MNRGGRMQGKLAVITGAGAGIGDAIARLFAEEGAAVVCIDRDRDAVERTARSISGSGARATARVADVSDPAEVSAACEWIIDAWGDPDVLVNNAGGGGSGDVGSIDADIWLRSIELNLGAAFHMSRALWPAFLRRRRGVILNNGSIMGLAGDANSIAYCSAKSGLIGLTRCLAADGAPHAIRANCICPGFVDTPAMRAVADHTETGRGFEDFEQQIPLGRVADPREIANAFLFLASDEASYITGSTLVVDGGATLGYLGSDLSVAAKRQAGAVP